MACFLGVRLNDMKYITFYVESVYNSLKIQKQVLSIRSNESLTMGTQSLF